jgi:4-hydroxybenzoate polyprenyltransferase
LKTSELIAFLRALLIVGRVSNLPTVWSNCLAGWWLGGAGNPTKLPFVFIGTTFLYLGGMFLNDAFDVEFDREHRKERPIPSRKITVDAVWFWGFVWLLVGIINLFCAGITAGSLGLALTFCIVLYDAIHKRIIIAPVLMGICRFFVYVIAAAAATKGVTGWAIWCGLGLGIYVIGLSYFARIESTPGMLRYWPLLLLVAPVLLGQLMNANGAREGASLLSAIVILWVAKSLRYALWADERNIGQTVSGLLAGIVFVDWLAVGPDAPRVLGLILIGCFLAALGFQRFVPAT